MLLVLDQDRAIRGEKQNVLLDLNMPVSTPIDIKDAKILQQHCHSFLCFLYLYPIAPTDTLHKYIGMFQWWQSFCIDLDHPSQCPPGNTKQIPDGAQICPDPTIL